MGYNLTRGKVLSLRRVLDQIDQVVIRDGDQLSIPIRNEEDLSKAQYELNEALKSAETFAEFGLTHLRGLVRVGLNAPQQALLVYPKGRRPSLTRVEAFSPSSLSTLTTQSELLSTIVRQSGEYVVSIDGELMGDWDKLERAASALHTTIRVLDTLADGTVVLKVHTQRPETSDVIDEEAIGRELGGSV